MMSRGAKGTTKDIPPELRANAGSRTDEFSAKLEKVKREIEQDIARNNGIYPYNGGRLSNAHICRRAKVNDTVLNNNIHKDSTRVHLETWRKDIIASIATGNKNIKKEITKQVHSWKNEHAKICANYHIANIKLENCRQEMKSLTEKNSELLKRNQILLAENLRLRNANVIPIKPKNS